MVELCFRAELVSRRAARAQVDCGLGPRLLVWKYDAVLNAEVAWTGLVQMSQNRETRNSMNSAEKRKLRYYTRHAGIRMLLIKGTEYRGLVDVVKVVVSPLWG